MIRPTLQTMSARLKERRKAARLSQGQVAEYEDVTQSYISQLEGGQAEPGVVDLLARLAMRYRTSLDYIVGLSNDPTPASRRELTPAMQEMRGVFESLDPFRQDELIRLGRAMIDNQARMEEARHLNMLIDIRSGENERSRTTKRMPERT